MLDIGIFAPFGRDHERNRAFCRDTAVRHIVLSVSDASGGEGTPDAGDLARLAGEYAAEGVTLAALTPPRVPQQAFADAEVRERELESIGRLLESMGTAGVPYVHFYLNVDPLSDDGERAALWQGLVEYYRGLAERAEAAGVKVSTHHYHVPDRLLWNYESMSRLLDQAPSANTGVTFCQGKSQMAGDDLVANILDYGDRIFMFHARDVETRPAGPVPPELRERFERLGYLEVAFGTGEVDMAGCFRALKRIGYKGQVYPEHYPSIAGDSAAGLAWTVGYMRALDQAIEV